MTIAVAKISHNIKQTIAVLAMSKQEIIVS